MSSPSHLSRIITYLRIHLNFYRLHLIAFTLIPLVSSAILYASNDRNYHVAYIDALFNSVSAMTVCGLATIDLSGLTGWQQVILFIQMCLGSPVLVSWITVYVRRHFFAKKFESAFRARLDEERRAREMPQSAGWPSRVSTVFNRTASRRVPTVPVPLPAPEAKTPPRTTWGRTRPPLTSSMIRRGAEAPRPINPSGNISERGTDAPPSTPAIEYKQLEEPPSAGTLSHALAEKLDPIEDEVDGLKKITRHDSGPIEPSLLTERINIISSPQIAQLGEARQPAYPMPRAQTIEFALIEPPRRDSNTGNPLGVNMDRTATVDRQSRRSSLRIHPTTSVHSDRTPQRSQHKNYGGFPLPHVLAGRLFTWLFPNAGRALVRSVTLDRGGGVGLGPRYFSFEVPVGHNSAFPLLTNEQLEELGGVEYRALNALLCIVAGYHIGSQLICYIIVAPYISQGKYKQDFLPPALHRVVPPAWYSLFQVVSAYTNTGMSLVDQSMAPFQEAFGLIFPIIFLVLAGNTAFPIFLRFTIWVISCLVPHTSRLNETLHFLLDHPRRCFLYLFPAHQTWFLLTVLAVLNCTDWFFFLVLDIGNSAIASIPIGTRFAIGLLQAVAVRAAGFGALSLSALAPAVKVLYVLMMYVSVYPVAMSVRSTNVYEEQSLGVFHAEDEDDVDDEFQPVGKGSIVWGRYLAMHARKQLSFDMWWLGLALFLVCIIERDSLTDDSKALYFNIFNILFELVSAYGSVGLSLGLPYANYSFSGAFRPLSKLIVCGVMLRGRHRGLPVAIDRAVMLPAEFRREGAEEDDAADAQGEEDAAGVPRTRTRTSTSNRQEMVQLRET